MNPINPNIKLFTTTIPLSQKEILKAERRKDRQMKDIPHNYIPKKKEKSNAHSYSWNITCYLCPNPAYYFCIQDPDEDPIPLCINCIKNHRPPNSLLPQPSP